MKWSKKGPISRRTSDPSRLSKLRIWSKRNRIESKNYRCTTKARFASAREISTSSRKSRKRQTRYLSKSRRT